MKICIVGNGGSGKTTLSMRLSTALEIPCFHIDLMRFDDDGVPVNSEVYHREQMEVLNRPGPWIFDGNAISTLNERLDAADALIFLDRHPLVCLFNVLRRRYRNGARRIERAEAKDSISWSFVKYIFAYRRTIEPSILDAVERHQQQGGLLYARLTSASDVEAFCRRAESGHLNEAFSVWSSTLGK